MNGSPRLAGLLRALSFEALALRALDEVAAAVKNKECENVAR